MVGGDHGHLPHQPQEVSGTFSSSYSIAVQVHPRHQDGVCWTYEEEGQNEPDRLHQAGLLCLGLSWTI